MNAQALLQQALGRLRSGDPAGAATLAQSAADTAPGEAAAWHLLGFSLLLSGRHEDALPALERAEALDPSQPDLDRHLADALQASGRLQEAVARYRRVVAANPADADARFNLGRALASLGDAAGAEACYRAILESAPNDAGALTGLSSACLAQERAGEALDAAESALAAQPEFVEAHAARARALRALGRAADAAEAFGAVLARRPDFAPAEIEAAECLLQAGRMPDAVPHYERAIALRPEDARARFHLGQVRVLLGDYTRGWQDMEWRFDADAYAARRPFPQPDWPGPPLAGRSLLLWGEQGVGDEILYATMLPALAGEDGRVTVECDPRFVPLFGRSFPGMAFVGKQTPPATELASGTFDHQCAVGSLGRYLRRSEEDFPAENAFLVPDPDRVAALRERYRSVAEGRAVVGVSWRSKKDRLGLVKSSEITDWGALLRRPDLFFVNLQYGDCAAELAAAMKAFGAEVHQDHTVDPLADLDGFAAQVAATDLVVTTSNATVHFAGALGLKTWLLLPGNVWDLPWYWGAGDHRSLWYPSVRILRMGADEGWPALVARAADEVSAS